jgi:hypothetical protein
VLVDKNVHSRKCNKGLFAQASKKITVQGEALNRALLIQFLVQATLYLNCCFGSPDKGLYVLFMMFDTALFSAMAARGDGRPQAAAEPAAGAVHLYHI